MFKDALLKIKKFQETGVGSCSFPPSEPHTVKSNEICKHPRFRSCPKRRLQSQVNGFRLICFWFLPSLKEINSPYASPHFLKGILHCHFQLISSNNFPMDAGNPSLSSSSPTDWTVRILCSPTPIMCLDGIAQQI